MADVQSLLGHWPFEVTAGGQPLWNRIRGRYVALAVGVLIVLTGLIVLILSR
jgi:hypothetical protein